jgi:hypothetical protein
VKLYCPVHGEIVQGTERWGFPADCPVLIKETYDAPAKPCGRPLTREWTP